jgi:hypothetical protein
MMVDNYIKDRRILLSVTTTEKSTWERKIADVISLGISEIAAFPTCLNESERTRMYKLLENSTVKKIPFVHLRSDMKPEELDYLIDRFKTESFNIHSENEYPLKYDYSEYKDKIYIENVYESFDENEIRNYAGICLDLSHLEGRRLSDVNKYKNEIKVIEKFKIGMNHISSVKKIEHMDENRVIRYDSHELKDLSELDYLKNFPIRYFAEIIAIELNNPIKEQIEVRDYVINIIDKKNA